MPAIPSPHHLPSAEVLRALATDARGLSHSEIAARTRQYGRNVLPRPTPPGIAFIFLRQFLSPLIYILLAAALAALFLKEWTDAGFILAVLLINAAIGTVQEFSAQRSAEALQNLVSTRVRVVREGDTYEIAADELVPGDIVLLESGTRIPADMRLLEAHALEIDESLLTGESLPSAKNAELPVAEETPLGDRRNMCFAGTHAVRGRGRGVVVATALGTELGLLDASLLQQVKARPPLMLRMDRFIHRIGLAVGAVSGLMVMTAVLQGTSVTEMFFMAVALAVSAIPEGLPVAITVALTISMKRMLKENVIVRRLVAVESLGSCTLIASDKTGTLTVNQLTVRRAVLPDDTEIEITGEGMTPEGEVRGPGGRLDAAAQEVFERLARTAVLCNEGFLGHRGGEWSFHGDTVDVALLIMAHKIGINRQAMLASFPQIAEIPFEPELRFAATLHQVGEVRHACVKGAAEALLGMCDYMATTAVSPPLVPDAIERRVHSLAAEGYRVMAVAEGTVTVATEPEQATTLPREQLRGLTLLGLVCMIDPLRAEAANAVRTCRDAGITVCMITGDHPVTAWAISRELGLVTDSSEVVTGTDIARMELAGPAALDEATRCYRVFARVEPQQKLILVESLIRNGHFVAVTGDGANDAPALRAAHVGVAMGQRGTDVARESADLVITDDNFASIVSGIREGRIAYSNIRKVIFLLISTGAAEVVLFLLALLTNMPLPLLAVQLLWLNLVTNGIQDVALAFDPAEGDEMRRAPRPPREPIFNRSMIERVALSAVFMGIVAFVVFGWLLDQGYSLEEARSGTLMLMVLFENVHVFNSRSESHSVLRHNPLRNPLLLFGTLAAQLVHIAAIYTPGLNSVLALHPVTFGQWLELLTVAAVLVLVMELHKLLRPRR